MEPTPASGSKPENRLVWLDLEMTGLNPDVDSILEIATLVTDSDLNVLAEGPVFAIHQPESALAAMDDWNQKQHGKSGLVERVRQSPETHETAELKTLEFLSQWVPAGKSPLCGNSIWQDRRFLFRRMPKLDAFFHYRLIDVSTVKELARRWYPSLTPYKKSEKHLALDDIRESVAELLQYRSSVFLPPPASTGSGLSP